MSFVPPVITIAQFSLASGVSPSGVRHLELPGSGWIKNVGTAAGEFLDFGNINSTSGKITSKTNMVIGMVDDMKDASEAVFNLRFYLTDTTAFNQGTFSFNGLASGTYFQNLQLTDTSGFFTTTALPTGQNWWRDAGGPFDQDSVAFQEITASGSDDQVTLFMYLSVTVDTDVPAKVYGGNDGKFQYRLTFDYR